MLTRCANHRNFASKNINYEHRTPPRTRRVNRGEMCPPDKEEERGVRRESCLLIRIADTRKTSSENPHQSDSPSVIITSPDFSVLVADIFHHTSMFAILLNLVSLLVQCLRWLKSESNISCWLGPTFREWFIPEPWSFIITPNALVNEMNRALGHLCAHIG